MAIIQRYTIPVPIIYSVRGIGSEKATSELIKICAIEKRPVILIESEGIMTITNIRALKPDVIICNGFRPSKSFVKSLKRRA